MRHPIVLLKRRDQPGFAAVAEEANAEAVSGEAVVRVDASRGGVEFDADIFSAAKEFER